LEPVYILGGLRTPIALKNGGLASVRPEIMGAKVCRELLTRQHVEPASLSGIFVGNAVGTGGNIGRLMSLEAGFPETVPVLTVDMQCASAAAAISLAFAKISAGQGDVFLAGGIESASLQPLRVYAPQDERYGLTSNADGAYYTAQFAPCDLRPDTMLRSAEKVIEAEHVSKSELDAWVLRSHQQAAMAQKAGIFADVMLPIGTCCRDEGIKPNMSQRLLDRLPPLFGKGTLLNAGNACRINDGAAFLLLASKSFCQRHNLTPQAEILATASLGGNPAESPRGAQLTAELLLRRQGLTFRDLAAIEFNEAFAVIDVLFARKYPDCLDRYNRFGGALAYGHPYGASGAIIALQTLASLRVADGELGLFSIAGAGGMGEAVLIRSI